MRKWEWSRSVLEQAKFYADYNSCFCDGHKGDFFYNLLKRRYILQLTKFEHKNVGESIDSDKTDLSSFGFAV